MKQFITICLLAFSSLALPAFASDNLEINNPWVREAPPNASILAAYMVIHNRSHQTRTLSRISSPDFDRIEIHRTEMHDGMAHMAQESEVVVKSQDKVSFEPGGLHIMLIEPKKDLKVGNNVQLTLHFTDNSTLNIAAPVKKGAGTEDHSSHDMGHGDHQKHDSGHNKDHKMNSEHHGH